MIDFGRPAVGVPHGLWWRARLETVVHLGWPEMGVTRWRSSCRRQRACL